MSKLINSLTDWLTKLKIRKQIFLIYVFTAFVPLLIIGTYLAIDSYSNLNNHYMDQAVAENNMIKAIMTELTTQVYSVSDDLSSSKELKNLISNTYESIHDLQTAINSCPDIKNYESNFAAIESVTIYTDNPGIGNYANFASFSTEDYASDWYKDTWGNYYTHWEVLYRDDNSGSKHWNMCLVRRLPMINSKYQAVLCIAISNEYINIFMGNSEFDIYMSVEDTICYCSDRQYIGTNINDGAPFSDDSIAVLKESKTYMSNSMIKIFTASKNAGRNIIKIILPSILVVVLALVISGLLISVYNSFFSHRVNVLRDEIHKVSLEDYEIIDKFNGDDELSDAYKDIRNTVENIKETKMQVYEAKIKEQDMAYQQQVMEFKMLSSQINPHFLYNTLGTLHMKALKSGDGEVADGIITLSQIMRYVLNNSGTTIVPLSDEIQYMENYLQLQKMRFGQNRLNYNVFVDPELDSTGYYVLPLLLQPLVENAILHGMDKDAGSIIVEIEINKTGDNVEIIISDNGAGIDKEKLDIIRSDMQNGTKTGTSIGIYNTSKRIKLCYGDEYGMEIFSKKNNGTTVVVKLPFESDKNVSDRA